MRKLLELAALFIFLLGSLPQFQANCWNADARIICRSMDDEVGNKKEESQSLGTVQKKDNQKRKVQTEAFAVSRSKKKHRKSKHKDAFKESKGWKFLIGSFFRTLFDPEYGGLIHYPTAKSL